MVAPGPGGVKDGRETRGASPPGGGRPAVLLLRGSHLHSLPSRLARSGGARGSRGDGGTNVVGGSHSPPLNELEISCAGLPFSPSSPSAPPAAAAAAPAPATSGSPTSSPRPGAPTARLLRPCPATDDLGDPVMAGVGAAGRPRLRRDGRRRRHARRSPSTSPTRRGPTTSPSSTRPCSARAARTRTSPCNVAVGDGTYKLVALVGIPAAPGRPPPPMQLVAFTDWRPRPPARPRVRVVNTGILALPAGTPDALPALRRRHHHRLDRLRADLRQRRLPGRRRRRAPSSTPTATRIDPAGLPSTGLLPHGLRAGRHDPRADPTGCQSTAVPPARSPRSIVASVYVIGLRRRRAQRASSAATPPPAAVPNYSACTSTPSSRPAASPRSTAAARVHARTAAVLVSAATAPPAAGSGSARRRWRLTHRHHPLHLRVPGRARAPSPGSPPPPS